MDYDGLMAGKGMRTRREGYLKSKTDLNIVVKVKLEVVDDDVAAGYVCGKRNRDSSLM